jgi:hypothetical protein
LSGPHAGVPFDKERRAAVQYGISQREEVEIKALFSRAPAFFLLLLAAAVSLSYLLFQGVKPVRVSIELAEKVPLSAEALLFTRESSTVRVAVSLVENGETGDGAPVFERSNTEEQSGEFRHSPDLISPVLSRGRSHCFPVLGLYPGALNRISFIVTTDTGVTYISSKLLRTEPLPSIFPDFEIHSHLPEQVSAEMLLLHLGSYDEKGNYTALPCVVDRDGRVRWYYAGDNGHLLRRLNNGNMMIQREESIVEVDLLGRSTGNRWKVPGGLHHDAWELPNGNFLALSSAEDSFYDAVVEIHRESGEIVDVWDFREIIDPERPVQPANLDEADWFHLNAVIYDEEDDALIVSGRDQSAVVKVGRESHELIWILGNHEKWSPRFEEYLLSPVGEDFEWQWGQHAPMLHPGNNSRILLFDNGNKRSYEDPLAAGENYSRAVEYEVDEERGTVRQLRQYGRERGSELYAPFIGDADYLPGENRLVCFGGITRNLQGEATEIFDFEQERVRKMKISARIVEVSSEQPARVVREIVIDDDDPDSYRGFRCYRADPFAFYPVQ